MSIILLRGFVLGPHSEENRGEELFVHGWTSEGFIAETSIIVVMLSPGGPDRRFCDDARGVTVAFAFLELPEITAPRTTFPSQSVVPLRVARYTCVRGEKETSIRDMGVEIGRGSVDHVNIA